MFREDVIISTKVGVDGLYGRYRGEMVAFSSLGGDIVEVCTMSSMEVPVLVSLGRGQRERQRETKRKLPRNTYTTPGVPYSRIPVTPFLAWFRWVGRALKGGSPKKGARSQSLSQRRFSSVADGLDAGQEEATRLPCNFDAASSSVPCSTLGQKSGTVLVHRYVLI